MIHTFLFDLDGTLLPMENHKFVHAYFHGVEKKAAAAGYEPKTFMKAFMAGSDAMAHNDGSRSNKDVFFDIFLKELGINGDDKLYNLFIDFYLNEYLDIVRQECPVNPYAAEVIRKLSDKKYQLALATNPFFPIEAVSGRIKCAGLEPDSFKIITTYDAYNNCKPDPAYFMEILSRMNAAPEDSIMVGNDFEMDMAAGKCGMDLFLVTDCLENAEDQDISIYRHGTLRDLSLFIDSLPDLSE